MIFFVLGIIDILGGTIIYFSQSVIFFSITKYLGLFLILKGIWSIISDIFALLQK
jgi:uncharacterized membrane protein HdeD (DUF308 family)